MDLEQIILQKINKYKLLVEQLQDGCKFTILIKDPFNCGRAMATENLIEELEEILCFYKMNLKH